MSTIISVEKLGKKYTLRHQQREPYTALRDVITNGVASFGKKLLSPFTHHSSPFTASHEDFWALNDVSFEVKQGDRIGIIGRNGAGKSTLLKILSRITEPTTGRVRIKGRVASLLEVGTGFHPELTGRENIYLNGAILGMQRAEIKKKFDEIVDFAEIEKFLDTPVKRYSSGMYVRLAFAVAAHLEPEILVVDEVLAVGDALFQKKCLGKMEDVSAKEGRTVLFVSHNMAAVQSLCTRGLLLKNGDIVLNGSVKEVVSNYLDTAFGFGRMPLLERSDRKGSQHLLFTHFELRNCEGASIHSVGVGEAVDLALSYISSNSLDLRNVHFAIGVHGRYDENLFHLSTNVQSTDFDCIPPCGEVVCTISKLLLQPGHYSLNIFSTVGGDIADWIQNAGSINVEETDFFGTGKLPPSDQGPYIVEHSWRLV